MKRTRLQRKTRLTAKHANGRPKTPIKTVNAERQAKRRKSYAQKLAAYRRSPTYKIVEARANGLCENQIDIATNGVPFRINCLGGRPLQHHHKTYARFGGQELPGDILAVCADCHARIEAQHPTRHQGRR